MNENATGKESLLMNRYKTCIFFAVTLLMLAVMVSGCREVSSDEATTMPTIKPEATVGETVPATEATLPKGEGVESVDSIEPPIDPDGEQTTPAEDTKPAENPKPTENTKPTEDTKSNESTQSTEETESTEDTGAAQGSKPTESTAPAKETKPAEGTEPSERTESTEGTEQTEETTPTDEPCCAYGAYLQMSAAQQQAYMNTFSSPLAFIDWCKTAEAEHEAHDDSVVVEGGDLDVGDYIDKNKE